MGPKPCDVEGLVYVSSMPFTTIKSNAKVGLRLFEGTVRTVKETSTMLAAPSN
jgi:hypothetical protein